MQEDTKKEIEIDNKFLVSNYRQNQDQEYQGFGADGDFEDYEDPENSINQHPEDWDGMV